MKTLKLMRKKEKDKFIVPKAVQDYNLGYQLGVSLIFCSSLLFIGKMKLILGS